MPKWSVDALDSPHTTRELDQLACDMRGQARFDQPVATMPADAAPVRAGLQELTPPLRVVPGGGDTDTGPACP